MFLTTVQLQPARYVMLAVAMALLAFIEPLRIAVCGDGAASSFDRKFAVALAGLSSPGSSFDGPHAAFSGIGSACLTPPLYLVL